MRQFHRQHYQLELDTKKYKHSPVTNLPAFMVGQIEGSVHGIEDLILDLNKARFGWVTDPTIETWLDFVMIRNINTGKPTVDIYAIPKTNDRTFHATPYGFYAIDERSLKEMIERWHQTQGVVATYIEGWLAGRARHKG